MATSDWTQLSGPFESLATCLHAMSWMDFLGAVDWLYRESAETEAKAMNEKTDNWMNSQIDKKPV